MAFSATLSSKQPDEEKIYIVDFSAGLSDGETISGASATGYAWDDRDQVEATYDLETDYPTADEVKVSIYGDGSLLGTETLSLASAQTDLTVKAVNDDAWVEDEDLIVGGTLGYDNTTAWLRVKGGVDGHTYKVTIIVTTSESAKLEADLVIPVEEA